MVWVTSIFKCGLQLVLFRLYTIRAVKKGELDEGTGARIPTAYAEGLLHHIGGLELFSNTRICSALHSGTEAGLQDRVRDIRLVTTPIAVTATATASAPSTT